MLNNCSKRESSSIVPTLFWLSLWTHFILECINIVPAVFSLQSASVLHCNVLHRPMIWLLVCFYNIIIHTTLLYFNLPFNNRKVYVLEDLSYEESEMKIINYQIGITIILHLTILAMSISIPFITMVSSPRLVVPDITKDQFGNTSILFTKLFWPTVKKIF